MSLTELTPRLTFSFFQTEDIFVACGTVVASVGNGFYLSTGFKDL